MKLSIACLSLLLASATAFTTQPTFTRCVVSMGAKPKPSADDLEKTRKVINDFMNKHEGGEQEKVEEKKEMEAVAEG